MNKMNANELITLTRIDETTVYVTLITLQHSITTKLGNTQLSYCQMALN